MNSVRASPRAVSDGGSFSPLGSLLLEPPQIAAIQALTGRIRDRCGRFGQLVPMTNAVWSVIMAEGVPPVVAALLNSSSAVERANRWEDFLRAYSDLLLRVARAMGGDEDATMNRFAFIVDHLAHDECRRLRAFVADGRAQFTTWLVVVAQRLALDEHRSRFGRVQSDSHAVVELNRARRALVDLVGNELELAMIPASDVHDAELIVRRGELHDVLDNALANLEIPDRLLLRLRFEEGLTVPQIARTTGARNPFHVYRQLDRVLTELRRKLAAAGVDGVQP